MSLQRQNQYARDEHEQAWQDAYSNAPPFQQKWGVGVDVQPPRRSALFDHATRSMTLSAFRAGHQGPNTSFHCSGQSLLPSLVLSVTSLA